MSKTVLITGSTDGIGLKTAKLLASEGHRVLLHGRSEPKLQNAISLVSEVARENPVQGYTGDLSDKAQVEAFGKKVLKAHPELNALINNAGVFTIPKTKTPNGLDLRFVVNTIAPYFLTHCLLPTLGPEGRVINLSSAAQAPVSLAALRGEEQLSDNSAYAQSKLALTMWSRQLGLTLKNGPIVVAVNPGSFLGSKMVKEAYGMKGGDLGKGARILMRASVGSDFAEANAQYFDNDSGRFGPPHPDAMDDSKASEVTRAVGALSELPAW